MAVELFLGDAGMVIATYGSDTGPPAMGEADIAQVGALLADRSRCRILLALLDGRALPASVLADEAGVGRATASSHLAKLASAGLVSAEQRGRHRYYRLSGPEAGELLEKLVQLSPATPVRSLREGTRAARLRAARSCYDHLAGRLGVALMDSLVDAGHVRGLELTAGGAVFLGRCGVAVPDGTRRPLVLSCVDWTEQRPHLAGALGKAVLDRFLEAGWAVRAERDRSLRVTPAGRSALAELFQAPWA